jgi:hypothetical protein
MIEIKLSEQGVDRILNASSREERGKLLLQMIEEKVERLQEWSRRALGEPMTKFEIAAVRTFLYREVTGELEGIGDITNLPHVKLDQHPASTP